MDNPIKTILLNFNLKNNLSSEAFSTFDENENNSIFTKLQNLEKKKENLSKMKEELKGFRQTIESMEFMKNAQNDIKNYKKNKQI